MAPSVWYRSYVSMKTSVGHWLANVAEQLMEEPMAVAVAKDLPEWDEGHVPLETVDPKDQNTPDCWVPRDKTIVRLTGRHPLNCEPPMAKMIEDFITPPAIHFVRNHGAVPKLSWRTHQIRVNGLVDSPLCITMQELLQMPAETIPVTMACAGNRRKENNAIKRTLGFGWGSSATSCTYMTGVKLHYILRLARIRTQEQGANYVCYRGPTQELPQGEDGSYGTSISVSHALDPVNDVMIVYKQNGEWLLPDHGYPVRMVVPGLIGARSVKWLSQITVTREESNNFYHYHDNKVLPPHVDDKIAREEGWFYKPDFIINELNINSAIARPSHDEFVSLKRDEPYKVQGYAYSGGGRKVIRVEVSLDDGDSWRACEIHRFEKPRVSGKHWCWVLWDIELRISELTTCKEIVCRAWDSSQNNQPNKITWNVMGMMNNSHFRVRIHKHLKENGEIGLRFQHPAPSEAGQWGSPGWRQQEQEAKPDEETLAMLPRIIDDEDIVVTEVPTKPLPGTPGSLSRTHTNPNLPERLMSMNLGSMNLDDHQPLIALNRKKKIPFKLIEKTKLSRDARRLRFALQSPQHILGLPIGNHMFFYAEIDGQTVMREYTPTSSNKQVGYFDLVIKVYFAGENPRFPEGGKMSQHFERMQIGDTIDVKGPVGHFVYSGPGKCLDNRRPHSFKKMCMVAGGTGITPMFQVADHILHDPNDDTQITLLFANRHEEDILMRDDLDEWSAKFKNFKVHYTLDRPPQGWEHNTGHIDYKMLERTLPSPDNESIVCLCGPPQMIKHACIPNLELLGWRKDQIVIF